MKSATWLTSSDDAAVWLLRDLALALDRTRTSTLPGMVPAARDLAELAGRASLLLRELGLTAGARYRLGLWETSVDDAFAEVFRLADAADRNTAE